MLWCDTPWCLDRESASDSRSDATGRPPSTAAAFTASPAATPEKPHRVPVPRLPGPCATTATSAPATCRAASSPLCTVTASRSPPNDCPVVTVAASQPASRSPATVRENHAGSAPPSCMTYTARHDGRAAKRPASTAGSAECRSATTTGIPSTDPASRSSSWCGDPCSSTLDTMTCRGVYRDFTICPVSGDPGPPGSRPGIATTNA